MYQALYRKYRPTTFDDVIGQEVVIRTLKNTIANKTLTHAYLFTGPRGTGKTSVAKIFAKTINCDNLKDFLPCNECVNCTQTNNKETTDTIEIDAASNNGVDEIRELRNKINLVPATSKYKVYIIDEVHMLTTGAFNALLKTLEEPPSHIIFILATTEPHKIPATILSRCQRFDFKKIGNSLITEKLKFVCQNEKIDAKDDALQEIAHLCDGGMRDALSLLDQTIAFSETIVTTEDVHAINGTLTQYHLKDIINAILEDNVNEIIQMLDKYNNEGKNLVKITEEMVVFLRNLLLKEKAPRYFEESIYNNDVYQSMKISSDKIYSIMMELNNAIKDMKKSNNPKINLELSIIKLCSNQPNINYVEDVKEIKQPTASKANDSDKEKVDNKKEKENSEKENNRKSKLLEETEEEIEVEKVNKVKLLEIQHIRVNNTLSNFKREYLTFVKDNLEKIRPLLLNEKYSQIVSLILDGTIKAASDEYIIIVYSDSSIADLFNENLLKIEKIIKSVYEKQYKAIAVTEEVWDNIKIEFNSKTKEYKFLKEPYELKEIIEIKAPKKDDNVKSLFGEIVEYN